MIGSPEVLPGGLFAGYAPPHGKFDEMLTAGQSHHPHSPALRVLDAEGQRRGLPGGQHKLPLGPVDRDKCIILGEIQSGREHEQYRSGEQHRETDHRIAR